MMLKRFYVLALLLALFTATQAQTKKPVPAKKPTTATKATPAKAAPAKPLQTATDSLSYAMGISVGQYLKAQGIQNVNYAALTKAIEQTFKDTPTYFGLEEANRVMERSAKTGIKRKAAGEREIGRQFLVKNKDKAGVVETASGLQYEILAAGTGPKPTRNDTILVHYAGRLLSGKEFDSSYSRGEPISIPVSGVIAGWTEAVQLMPTGSKWRLYIPSQLAYGDNGAGHDIPGGATLVFDVELLQIGTKKK